ncbi:MAG TPA: type III-A CRISPR-associated RAMP protein Csm5 [Syntrophorhabdus sp.]|jgi:CRISPR type III-A-associated RAMP protein Csm5|nr:type III-A CRISPR-associated RAMP protein Csm5 [Syntrophorhabdus sp.]
MARIELQTLSPVHVGSGRFLQSNMEYVFGKENIGVVDEHKVFNLLGEDRISAWVASIERGESLVAFLKGFDLNFTLQKISGRIISLACEKSLAKDCASLKENIHNGQGLPYLPGSSIKGSIRSALFNQIIRERSTGIEPHKIENRGKISASVLEKEIFGNDPNHDVFRFLRVGDAYFRPNGTVALMMENLNIKERAGEEVAVKDSSKKQLVEAIGTGEKADFVINIDKVGIKLNSDSHQIRNFPAGFESIVSLFKLINRNTEMILEMELKFWEEYQDDIALNYVEQLSHFLQKAKACNHGECIMRMSHGSGWSFITGGWSKESYLVEDDLYWKIRRASRPGEESRYSHLPFPKSRRISSSIELPGMVLLRIKEE